jgi:hypothetical protein
MSFESGTREVNGMRKGIWLVAVIAVLIMPQLSSAQQASQSAQTSQSSSDKQAASQPKPPAQTTSQATAAKTQSLADAARKAREAQKNAPKAPMVFTNDNIPMSSTGVSVVGQASSSDQSASSSAPAAADNNDEATWRKRFADARHKVDQDSAELSVLQREMGELNVQYYPDPTQALMQSVTREDLTKKQAAIDAKQKQLDADKQALSDLEDELRKAGGDPAWARE